MVMTRSSSRRVEEAGAGNVNGDQQLLCLTLPGFSPNLHNQEITRSVPASRGWPLGYVRRVSYSHNESTEATCLVGRVTRSGKCLGVQPSADPQNVDSELCEGADYMQLVYPSLLQCEETDKNSVKKAIILSDAVADRTQSFDQADSNSTSLNISDMFMLEDEISSIDSKQVDVLATVGGYRVKHDLEPILRGIISKYGDIASQCRKSLGYRSLLVESVCNIVQKLQTTEFVYLTTPEIDSFRLLLKDMEPEVNVGWLLHRLDEIDMAKRLLRHSPKVKQAKRQNQQAAELKEVEIKGCEEEICKLQENLKSAKHQMEFRKEEKRKLDNILSHTKAQLKKFQCRGLADGLI